MKDRSFGVAIDTIITPDTLITTLTDSLVYEDGSNTTNWNVYGGSTTVSSIGGQINVSSSASTFLWGTSRYFTTQAGVTYTVNFYLDMGTCTGTTIRSEIIDNTFTTSVFGTYTTSGHKSYTFTATGSGFGGITFVMNYPGAACDFDLDSVLITYDSTVTTLDYDSVYIKKGYRYGFNGMEKDNDMKSADNSYHTLFREYDPRLARWLAIDPKNTASESPYSSMDNTPLFKCDPLGDTVRIHYVEDGVNKTYDYDGTNTYLGNNEFVKSAIGSMEDAQSHGGSKTVMKLVNSKKVLNIVERHDTQSPEYVSKGNAEYKNKQGKKIDGQPYVGNTIYWNPESGGLLDEKGGGKFVASSESLLYHEMVHAKHSFFGHLWFRVRLSIESKFYKYDNLEERKTIKETNKVYNQKRNSHNGRYTKVSRPKFDPPIMDLPDMKDVKKKTEGMG